MLRILEKFMQDLKQDLGPDAKLTEKQDPDPKKIIPDLQHWSSTFDKSLILFDDDYPLISESRGESALVFSARQGSLRTYIFHFLNLGPLIVANR